MAQKEEHLKKLNLALHPLGLALGITTAVIYTLCSFFITVLPSLSLKIFNIWFHGMDLTRLATSKITLNAFILGLVTLTLVSYLTGILFAWIYNLCISHCVSKGWI